MLLKYCRTNLKTEMILGKPSKNNKLVNPYITVQDLDELKIKEETLYKLFYFDCS